MIITANPESSLIFSVQSGGNRVLCSPHQIRNDLIEPPGRRWGRGQRHLEKPTIMAVSLLLSCSRKNRVALYLFEAFLDFFWLCFWNFFLRHALSFSRKRAIKVSHKSRKGLLAFSKAKQTVVETDFPTNDIKLLT